MTTHALHPISTSGIAAAIALLVASCSLLPQRQPEHGQAARAAQAVPGRHIAQMDFGRDASFAVCTEPACPAVTPKALAVTPATGAAANAPAPSNAEVLPSGVDRAAAEPSAAATAKQHQVAVQFMSGSAVLTAAGETVLAQSLAFSRALAVRDYLLEREPELPARIEIDAKGRCCFIASNDTPQGRRQNRRVEVVFNVPEQVTP